MRQIGILGLVLAALFHVPQAEAQQGGRIGYIDSQVILQEAPGAQEAQAEFDRQVERLSLEVQSMEEELDNLIAEYQAQQATFLPNVRQARESEIQQRELRYQQRLQEMDQELAGIRQRLIEPILLGMSDTIETIRSEGSYALIFDVQGQSIVAADPALDLTEEVLRRLRQQAGTAEP